MLKRIDIKHYRNLENVSLKLEYNNALIYGENGIGKTNLCRTLEVLRKMLLMELSPNGAYLPELSNCHLVYYFDCTEHLKYIIDFDTDGALALEELQINEQTLYKYSHLEHQYIVEQFMAYNMNLPCVNSFTSYDIIMPVLRLIFNSGIASIPIKEMMSEVYSWVLVDGVELCTKKATVLRQHEVTLLNGLLYKTGMHLSLRVSDCSDPELMLETKDGYLPFNMVASTGERAIVNLILTLNRYKTCSLICIDEFDAFYHYTLAKRMLTEIIPQLGKQYILTTHNTSCLNLVDYKQVYILNRTGCYHLAELTTRKLRSGLNYEHLFRAGEFNA